MPPRSPRRTGTRPRCRVRRSSCGSGRREVGGPLVDDEVFWQRGLASSPTSSGKKGLLSVSFQEDIVRSEFCSTRANEDRKLNISSVTLATTTICYIFDTLTFRQQFVTQPHISAPPSTTICYVFEQHRQTQLTLLNGHLRLVVARGIIVGILCIDVPAHRHRPRRLRTWIDSTTIVV